MGLNFDQKIDTLETVTKPKSISFNSVVRLYRTNWDNRD